MKLTLAYPWTDGDGTVHDAGKTVTVDDEIGRQMLHDGNAQKAEPGTRPSPKPKTAKADKPAEPADTTTSSEEG